MRSAFLTSDYLPHLFILSELSFQAFVLSPRPFFFDVHFQQYGRRDSQAGAHTIYRAPRHFEATVLHEVRQSPSHTAAATSGMTAICHCTGNTELDSSLPFVEEAGRTMTNTNERVEKLAVCILLYRSWSHSP